MLSFLFASIWFCFLRFVLLTICSLLFARFLCLKFQRLEFYHFVMAFFVVWLLGDKQWRILFASNWRSLLCIRRRFASVPFSYVLFTLNYCGALSRIAALAGSALSCFQLVLWFLTRILRFLRFLNGFLLHICLIVVLLVLLTFHCFNSIKLM